MLEHSQNYLALFIAILLLCVAVQILASHSISMSQAHSRQEFLCKYLQACLMLSINLVINHHMSIHYLTMFKLFSHVYAWWLFTFERFNGMLEWVKINGKDGRGAELTLLTIYFPELSTFQNWTPFPCDCDCDRNCDCDCDCSCVVTVTVA